MFRINDQEIRLGRVAAVTPIQQNAFKAYEQKTFSFSIKFSDHGMDEWMHFCSVSESDLYRDRERLMLALHSFKEARGRLS